MSARRTEIRRAADRSAAPFGRARASTCARIAVLLACVLGTPLGLGAARADPGVWESEWSFELRSGRWAEATKLLTPAAAKELAASPKDLFLAARSAAVYIAPTLRRGLVDQIWIANWFAAVATEARTSATPTAQLSRALAAVAGLTCRSAGAIGSGAGPDDAKAIAEHTLAFYRESAATDGGVALLDALGWIRAVLFVDGVESAPVLAIQQSLYDQLAVKATGPQGPAAKAELEFARAVATADAGAAKTGVERGLGLLKPVVSVTPPPPDPARLVNDLLNFASDRKLGVRGDYVMETRNSTDGKLRVGLPIGLGWSTYKGSKASSLSIARSGRGGGSLYAVEIHAYDAQRTFTSAVGGDDVIGSDLKAVANQRFEIDRAEFTSVASKREPRAATVGRSFGTGFSYELVGADATAENAARRGWIVKGKVYPFTYCILAVDYSGSESPPTELMAVVESIGELKAAR